MKGGAVSSIELWYNNNYNNVSNYMSNILLQTVTSNLQLHHDILEVDSGASKTYLQEKYLKITQTTTIVKWT